MGFVLPDRLRLGTVSSLMTGCLVHKKKERNDISIKQKRGYVKSIINKTTPSFSSSSLLYWHAINNQIKAKERQQYSETKSSNCYWENKRGRSIDHGSTRVDLTQPNPSFFSPLLSSLTNTFKQKKIGFSTCVHHTCNRYHLDGKTFLYYFRKKVL